MTDIEKILQFAIPVLFTSLMQQLYHAADSIIVGNFASGEALAAVGSTGALTGLIVNLFMDISIGSNVYCARCYGAKDSEGLSRAVHTSLLLGLLLGIPVAVIGWLFSDNLLVLMGTPEEIVDQAALYMRIIFL